MKLLTSNLKHFMLRFHFIFILSTGILSTSIAQKSEPGLLNDSLLQHAHIGICIYDPAANKYLYQHDANKYFVPASNTKLFTLYAGLKYLGDSITGLKYQYINDSSIEIYPTGDPTFMHPAFPIQPVYDFLCNKRSVKIAQWDTLNEYAPGWAWEDQQEDYMIPKNPFPIYGNLLNITLEQGNKLNFSPDYFRSKTILGDNIMKGFSIMKIPGENSFRINNGKKTKASVPFHSNFLSTVFLLHDTLHNLVTLSLHDKHIDNKYLLTIHSQSVDSVFKFMMYNSDNFFADQTLLMVSNEKLGYMDDAIIDTLMKSDYADLPDKPRWVDGSGLSRYNLFTPQDLVNIISKLIKEFGQKRIAAILPAGNEGTLKNYFIDEGMAIHAKSGSMGNIYAISGYMHTKKDKQLIFSIIINNYISSSSLIRRAIERYIQKLIINN